MLGMLGLGFFELGTLKDSLWADERAMVEAWPEDFLLKVVPKLEEWIEGRQSFLRVSNEPAFCLLFWFGFI